MWTGEEQGLLGSAGYVRDHANELEKMSACIVDDGGTNYHGSVTGYETGVLLSNNDVVGGNGASAANAKVTLNSISITGGVTRSCRS